MESRVPAPNLLAARARNTDHQLARIHAIWALGQIGRTEPAALEALLPILADKDAEVLAQTIKVLADDRDAAARKLFIPFLKNEAPRVRSAPDSPKPTSYTQHSCTPL